MKLPIKLWKQQRIVKICEEKKHFVSFRTHAALDRLEQIEKHILLTFKIKKSELNDHSIMIEMNGSF